MILLGWCGSAGISCVPLSVHDACRIRRDAAWEWPSRRVPAGQPPARAGAGAAQVSVLAIGSLSVASYAATSSTGSSAVASVSTSEEDATVFTGGIEEHPQIRSYGRDSSPGPQSREPGLLAFGAEMRACFSFPANPTDPDRRRNRRRTSTRPTGIGVSFRPHEPPAIPIAPRRGCAAPISSAATASSTSTTPFPPGAASTNRPPWSACTPAAPPAAPSSRSRGCSVPAGPSTARTRPAAGNPIRHPASRRSAATATPSVISSIRCASARWTC